MFKNCHSLKGKLEKYLRVCRLVFCSNITLNPWRLHPAITCSRGPPGARTHNLSLASLQPNMNPTAPTIIFVRREFVPNCSRVHVSMLAVRKRDPSLQLQGSSSSSNSSSIMDLLYLYVPLAPQRPLFFPRLVFAFSIYLLINRENHSIEPHDFLAMAVIIFWSGMY